MKLLWLAVSAIYDALGSPSDAVLLVVLVVFAIGLIATWGLILRRSPKLGLVLNLAILAMVAYEVRRQLHAPPPRGEFAGGPMLMIIFWLGELILATFGVAGSIVAAVRISAARRTSADRKVPT
jgi:hypothetical protein